MELERKRIRSRFVICAAPQQTPNETSMDDNDDTKASANDNTSFQLSSPNQLRPSSCSCGAGQKRSYAEAFTTPSISSIAHCPKQVTESRAKYSPHGLENTESLPDRYHGKNAAPLVDFVKSPPPSPKIPVVYDLCTPPSPKLSTTFHSTDSAIPTLNVATTSHPELHATSSETQPAVSSQHGSSTAPPARYSKRQSAYLQNLAEMCYVILNDYRWRTSQPIGQTLFRWENGEDLKLVHTLARHYLPPPPKVSIPCVCLLCRGHSKNRKKESDSTQLSPCQVATSKNPAPSPPQNNIDQDNDESRRLYLLSRLFYRKGPWFRLDDLYARYYLPKKEQKDATKGLVNKKLLEHRLQTIVPEMLRDVAGLVGSGLVRHFASESECGKVVEDSVLTADERRSVFVLLGGNKKKMKQEGSIWKQMKSQRSLFTKSGLLPVIRHVNEALLDRLARQVVISCCSTTKEVPQREMRVHLAPVKMCISKLLQQGDGGTALSCLCFRLTERPTECLLRCLRLYLCATSGPGNMRGDGTNGWRSVKDIPDLPKSAGVSVVPSSKSSWHEVRYPGLEYRFGLRSAPFFHTYQHVLCNDKTNRLNCMQIFASGVEFRKWEVSVEIRAFVDYAIGFEDALRYDQRRVTKGKDPIRGCKLDDFVDTLRLHSETERLSLLGTLMHGCYDAKLLSSVAGTITTDLNSLPEQDRCCRSLVSTGVIIIHVIKNLSSLGVSERESRPSMRHLCWRCCLAYILWDIMYVLVIHWLCYFNLTCPSVLCLSEMGYISWPSRRCKSSSLAHLMTRLPSVVET